MEFEAAVAAIEWLQGPRWGWYESYWLGYIETKGSTPSPSLYSLFLSGSLINEGQINVQVEKDIKSKYSVCLFSDKC